jgi:hypothetical protein
MFAEFRFRLIPFYFLNQKFGTIRRSGLSDVFESSNGPDSALQQFITGTMLMPPRD